MKRKFFSILMVLCMVTCLFAAGCKKDKEKENETDAKPTKTVEENKTNDPANTGDPTGGNDVTDVGGVTNPIGGTTVVPDEKENGYLSVVFKDAVANMDDAVKEVKSENAATMELDVTLGGTLKQLVEQYISLLDGTAPNKMNAKLTFDIAQKDADFSFSGKVTFNGQSLDAKLVMKDGIYYVGVPALSDKYLKLDLKDFVDEDMLAQIPEVKDVDVAKYQEIVKNFADELTKCVTPSKSEKNAAASVKNTALGLDVTVTGTKYVDIIDGKKISSTVEKFMKDILKLAGIEDDMSDITDELEMEDLDNATLEYVKNDDGSFAVYLINKDNDIVKFVSNAQYFVFATQGEGEADEVHLYVKKTGAKSGNIYLVDDGAVIDSFDLSYQLLDDGVKLMIKAEAGEGNLIDASLTLSKSVMAVQVKFTSGGEEWVNATLSVKEKAYNAQDINGIKTVDSVEEWAESFTMDKIDEFLNKTIGVSLDSILALFGGSDDDWDDDDWDWDDDDWDWDDDDWDWDDEDWDWDDDTQDGDVA